MILWATRLSFNPQAFKGLLVETSRYLLSFYYTKKGTLVKNSLKLDQTTFGLFLR